MALDFPIGQPNGAEWTDPSNGVKYTYDLAKNSWTASIGGSGGGAATIVAEDPPSVPIEGQLWWCTTDGRLYVYYNDGDSSQWVPATPETGLEGGGGGASVDVGENPPTDPSEGNLWWNTNDGLLYIAYDNSGNMRWVVVSGGGGGGGIPDDWSNIPVLPVS